MLSACAPSLPPHHNLLGAVLAGVVIVGFDLRYRYDLEFIRDWNVVPPKMKMTPDGVKKEIS